MSVKQTQEQWIRSVLRVSLEASPDKQATIDNGIEALRVDEGQLVSDREKTLREIGEDIGRRFADAPPHPDLLPVQTQEQWIRGVMGASLPTSPDKQATIDNGIEALRSKSGHKLDEPCPPAARISRATVDP